MNTRRYIRTLFAFGVIWILLTILWLIALISTVLFRIIPFRCPQCTQCVGSPRQA